MALLGIGAKSTKYIAKKIIKRCSDTHDVAIFDKYKTLLAYAKSPSAQEIETFRITSKTRLVATLFMMFFIILFQLKYPVVSFTLLALIGINTLYGWEKYSIRCKSTFGMNMIIALISYYTAIYYIFNANHVQLLVIKSYIPGMEQIIPLIILTLILTLFIGYVLSHFTVGDIEVMNKTQCLYLDKDRVLQNKNIDKYVISKNGDYHLINNDSLSSNKDVKTQKKHNFNTQAPKVITPISKK